MCARDRRDRAQRLPAVEAVPVDLALARGVSGDVVGHRSLRRGDAVGADALAPGRTLRAAPTNARGRRVRDAAARAGGRRPASLRELLSGIGARRGWAPGSSNQGRGRRPRPRRERSVAGEHSEAPAPVAVLLLPRPPLVLGAGIQQETGRFRRVHSRGGGFRTRDLGVMRSKEGDQLEADPALQSGLGPPGCHPFCSDWTVNWTVGRTRPHEVGPCVGSGA